MRGVNLDQLPEDEPGVRLDTNTPPTLLLLVAKQLFASLQFLHRIGIVFRDIKNSNLMIDEKRTHLTLIDFGTAKLTLFEPSQTFCGTFVQMAPEQLSGEQYTEKVDIWAAGVSLYALAFGK